MPLRVNIRELRKTSNQSSVKVDSSTKSAIIMCDPWRGYCDISKSRRRFCIQPNFPQSLPVIQRQQTSDDVPVLNKE